MTTEDFDYDLQDDDEPAKLSKDLSGFRVGFNPEIGQNNDHFWQVTKIVEEKGMFDKLIGNKRLITKKNIILK